MENKKIIILAIILVVIFMIICACELLFNSEKQIIKNDEEVEEIEEEISKTKDIKVTYKDITIYKEDGKEEKLSDYKDMPIMILFWNEKNEDSVEDLKKVDKLYSKYEDKIKFFMINTSDKTNEKLKNEISIEIYYDTYKEAEKKYGIEEVPTLIYINKGNEVFNAKTGFTTVDALEANLDILSENF